MYYNNYNESVAFSDLVGKKIIRVTGSEGDGQIEFFTECR